MTKKSTLIFILLIMAVCAFAASRQNAPVTITQPNGEEVHIFVSGNEFYHRLHDKDGYTIVQNPNDGWFYYAKLKSGDIVPSKHKVGSTDPQKTSLKPNVNPSVEKLRERHQDFYTPAEMRQMNAEPKSSSQKTTFSNMNNVVILIRFNDDTEFSLTNLQEYDTVCNGVTNSLKHYYNEVSYGGLDVKSYFYPWYGNIAEYSYKDSHDRGYFRPYNAATNNIGYKTDYESASRRQAMLTSAVQWVNSHTPVPPEMNLDSDGDGFVDNVSFIIRGESDDWMDLLWAHRSNLMTGVQLQNKTVSTYIFMPENQADRRIFCHEFFHALGAPDLYHYYNGTDLTPVGSWDIMESGIAHISSYMKKRYADWVTIDTIKKAGIYSVKPLGNNSTNVAWTAVIKSGTIKQSLIMEYRKKGGLYESSLPGSGLLVYRLNPQYSTNADYDGSAKLDMLYVFRPMGTQTANGIISNAHFSQLEGRTFVSDSSTPTRLFKSRGEVTGMGIYNVNVTDDSASFYFHYGDNFTPSEINSFYNSATGKIDISWNKNVKATGSILVVSYDNNFQYLNPDITYNVGDILASGANVIYKGSETSFSHTPEKGKAVYYTVFSIQSSGYSLGITSRSYSPAEIIECSVFANIDTLSSAVVVQADTTSQWGYFAGHSGSQNTIFAEYFNNADILLVKGLTINIAKSVAVGDGSVNFWIADASDVSQTISRTTYQDSRAISELSEGVNEIIFKNPVMIKKDFLAGFTISYSNGDTFALKVAPATGNTQAGKYTTQMYVQENYSMAIFPLACNGIEGQTGFFIVSPDTIVLAAAKNSAGQTNVWIDGRDWSVTSILPDWLNTVLDKDEGILNISAIASNQYKTRSARITLSASNGETRIVKIGQRGFGNPEPSANEDIAIKSKIRLYPNPSANGIFKLDLPENSAITVFDVNGKTLIGGTATKGISTIDLSAEHSGIYFLRLQENGIGKILKLVKR
ncbi:MAG: M6 family metalloprotease domain-containing protein [Bacteroidales bacterium]|jgi:M6 family metalloprotease-like protein|nr:M6 family metalloprotease domain-containing protein [Bacteroidales bacterium]